MAFVVKINGQVVEVNSIAELSWLGCMIPLGTNGNNGNNGNNNGNGVVANGLLEYRKQDKEQWKKLRRWIVKQYNDEVTAKAIVNTTLEDWGCKINSGVVYRLGSKCQALLDE